MPLKNILSKFCNNFLSYPADHWGVYI